MSTLLLPKVVSEIHANRSVRFLHEEWSALELIELESPQAYAYNNLKAVTLEKADK